MPKGTRGCYICGSREEATRVQVWMRAYSDEKYANGCRKQVSVDSRMRVFCPLHAEDAYLAAIATLEREWPRLFGCALCGEPSAFRIQAMMGSPAGALTASCTSSYCPTHAEPTFDAACAPLAGEWHYTGQGTPGVTGFARVKP